MYQSKPSLLTILISLALVILTACAPAVPATQPPAATGAPATEAPSASRVRIACIRCVVSAGGGPEAALSLSPARGALRRAQSARASATERDAFS